jgi:hypothetical protein
MTNFNVTFTSGSAANNNGLDATYQWSATMTELSSGDFQVQVTCLYGGGAFTNITAQTEPIPWSSGPSASYQVVTAGSPDPQIGVDGSVVVNFDETPGSEFVVVFTGTMSLSKGAFNANCQEEMISGTGLIVAAQLSLPTTTGA